MSERRGREAKNPRRSAPNEQRASQRGTEPSEQEAIRLAHQTPLLERMANDPKAPSLGARQLLAQSSHGNKYVQRLVGGTLPQRSPDRDVLTPGMARQRPRPYGTVAGEPQRILANKPARRFMARTVEAGETLLQRQAPGGGDWAQRVQAAKALGGADRDQACMDLISEALNGLVTMHASTNNEGTLPAAIAAGHYEEYGNAASPNVNFDWNLAMKSGAPSGAYGRTQRIGDQVYLILGPNAVKEFGPQVTEMAFEHENAHAIKDIVAIATGGEPAKTTEEKAANELEIYSEGFNSMLDLVRVDAASGRWTIADDFRPIFDYYLSAAEAARDAAFDSIKMFYEVRVQRVPDNLVKFRVWFQSMRNALPNGHPLVTRINALPGLRLAKGTDPTQHIPVPQAVP